MTDDEQTPVPITSAKGDRPARNYKWETFHPGNRAGVVHGAHSPSIVAALAEQFAQAAIAASPVLGLDRFKFAMRAWSHAEARAELVRRHLDENGVLNNRNAPRVSLLAVLAASERAAQKGRSELGLSPESAARIATLLRIAGADVLSPGEQARYLPSRTQRRIER